MGGRRAPGAHCPMGGERERETWNALIGSLGSPNVECGQYPT